MTDGVIFYKKEEADDLVRAFAELAHELHLPQEESLAGIVEVLGTAIGEDSYADDSFGVLDASLFKDLRPGLFYWDLWQALAATYDAENPLTADALLTDENFTDLAQNFEINPESLLLQIPEYFVWNPDAFISTTDNIAASSEIPDPLIPVVQNIEPLTSPRYQDSIFIDVANIINTSPFVEVEKCSEDLFLDWDELPPVLDVLFQYFSDDPHFDWLNPNPYQLTQTEWANIVAAYGNDYQLDADNSWQTLQDMVARETNCPDTMVGVILPADFIPDNHTLTAKGVDAYVVNPDDFYVPYQVHFTPEDNECRDLPQDVDIESLEAKASFTFDEARRIDLTPKRFWLPSQLLTIDVLQGASVSAGISVYDNEFEFTPDTPVVYLKDIYLNSRLHAANALDIELKALGLSYDAYGNHGKISLVLDRHDYEDLDNSSIFQFLEEYLGDGINWAQKQIGMYDSLIKIDITALVKNILGDEASSLFLSDGTLKPNLSTNDLYDVVLKILKAPPAPPREEGLVTDLITQAQGEGMSLLQDAKAQVSLTSLSASYYPSGNPDCTEPDLSPGFHFKSVSVENGFLNGWAKGISSFYAEGKFPITFDGYYVDDTGTITPFEIPHDKPLVATLTLNGQTREARVAIDGEDLPLPLASLLGSTRGTVDPLVVDIPGIETGTLDLSGLDQFSRHGNELSLVANLNWKDFNIADLSQNDWAAHLYYALNGFFKDKVEEGEKPSSINVSLAGEAQLAPADPVQAQVTGRLGIEAQIAAKEPQRLTVEDGFYTAYWKDSSHAGAVFNLDLEASQGRSHFEATAGAALYNHNGDIHLKPRINGESNLGIASEAFNFGITGGELVFSPHPTYPGAELFFETPLSFYTDNLAIPFYDGNHQSIGSAHLGPTQGLISGNWLVDGPQIADIVRRDLIGSGKIQLTKGSFFNSQASLNKPLDLGLSISPADHLNLDISNINLSKGIPGLLYDGGVTAGALFSGNLDHISWGDLLLKSRRYGLNLSITTPGIKPHKYADEITLDGLIPISELVSESPNQLHEKEIEEKIKYEIKDAAPEIKPEDAALLARSVERFMITLEKGDIDWSDQYSTRTIKNVPYLEIPLNAEKPKGVKILVPLIHYVDPGHRILGEKYKLSTLDIDLTRPIYLEVLPGIKIPINGLKLVTRPVPFVRRERRGEVVELRYANGNVLIVQFYNNALTRMSDSALLSNTVRLLKYEPNSYKILRINGRYVNAGENKPDWAEGKPLEVGIIPYVSTFLISWGDNNQNRAKVEIFTTDFSGMDEARIIEKIKEIILGADKTRYRILTLNVADADTAEENISEDTETPEMQFFRQSLISDISFHAELLPEQERVFLHVDGRQVSMDIADAHLYATGIFGLRQSLKREIEKDNYTIISYEDEAGNAVSQELMTSEAKEEITKALLSGKFCGIDLEDRNAFQRGRHVLVAKVGVLRINIFCLLDLIGFFQKEGPLDAYNKTFYKNLREKHGLNLPRNTVPTKIEELVVFVRELMEVFQGTTIQSDNDTSILQVADSTVSQKYSKNFFVGILGVIFDSLVVQLDDMVVDSSKLEKETVVGLGESGSIHIFPEGPFTLEGEARLHVTGNEPTHAEISLAGRSGEALPSIELNLNAPNEMQMTVEDMHNLTISADFLNGLSRRPMVSFGVEDARVSGPLEFAFKDTVTGEDKMHFVSDANSYVRGNVSYTYTPVYDDAGNLVAQLHIPVIELEGKRSVVLGGAKVFFTSGNVKGDNEKPLAGFFNAGDVFEISDGHMNFSFKVVPEKSDGNLNEGLNAERVTISTIDIDLPFVQQNGHAVLSLGDETRNLSFNNLSVKEGRIKVQTKPNNDNEMTPEFSYIFDDIVASLDIPNDPRIASLGLHLKPYETNLSLTGDGTIRLFGPEGGITEAADTLNPLVATLKGPLVLPVNRSGFNGFLKIDELVVHISDLQFELLPDPADPKRVIPSLKNFTGYVVGQGSLQGSFEQTLSNGDSIGLTIPPQPWRMASRQTTISFSDMNDWGSLEAHNNGFQLSVGVDGRMMTALDLGETSVENGQVSLVSAHLDSNLYPYFESLVHGILYATARVGLDLKGTSIDLGQFLPGME